MMEEKEVDVSRDQKASRTDGGSENAQSPSSSSESSSTSSSASSSSSSSSSSTLSRATTPRTTPMTGKRSPARSTFLPLRLLGWILRCLLVDTPLLLLFASLVATVALQHLNDDYFEPQLKLMTFIEAQRDYTDTTYYHRYCDEDDISTTDVADLVIPPNYTAQDCARHMLTHGASMYRNLLTPTTAARLREFIDRENKIQEGWFVIKNKHRYSWGIDVNMHAALHTFWKELGSNEQLVAGLEAIVGPDPAVIEFTAITSAYGAVDQYDHSDVIPHGSAAKFGRTFVPSYSLFIPLQDVTYDMGATHVCPGTHLCSKGCNEACPRNHNNVAMSGGKGRDDPRGGVWKCGDGALVNQQTTHKGMGHTHKGGLDRVVIIATFAPRPRFGKRPGVETRMIGQGGSYSLLWTQYGHTLSDYINADTRMTEPQKTLRSLGLLKGKGWNWPTVSSMRIANEDNGFNEGDLEAFVEGGGFWFLPSSWQALDYEDESKALLPWHAFLLGTVQRVREELTSMNLVILCVYFGILLICDISLMLVNRKTSLRRSFTLHGIGRIILTHGLVLGVAWACMRSIQSTNWARNIRAGRSWQIPYVVSGPDGNVPFSTIPDKTDILMVPHYASSYLASYSQVVHVSHPGNRHWKEVTSNVGLAYKGMSPTLQKDFCESLISSIQVDRRFLKQDVERYWYNVDDKDELLSFCHRELVMESGPLMKVILQTLDEVRSETQFGQWRDKAIHRTHVPSLLEHLEDVVLPTGPNKKSTVDKAEFRLPSRWMPPSFLSQMPNTGVSTSYSRKYLLPPTPLRTEPFPGAWLQEEDDVEVKYKCRYNEWYRAKIVGAVPNTATFDIMYIDGEQEFAIKRSCVRRFVPYHVGEDVEARTNEEATFHKGHVVRVLDNNRCDVELEGGQVIEAVLPMHIRRYNPVLKSIPVGTRVVAQYQGGSESFPGVVHKVNVDGTLDIQYDDGDFERSLNMQFVEAA